MNKPLVFVGLYWAFLIFFLFHTGCIHNQKKNPNHSDFLLDSTLTTNDNPESKLYSDLSDADWEQRLKEDANILFQMMTTIASSEVTETVQSKTEEFSEKISKYPRVKHQFLKNAAHTYFRFFKTIKYEATNYFDSLEEGSYRFDNSRLHQISESIEDTLVEVYGIKEVDGSCDEMDSTLAYLRFEVSFGDKEQLLKNKTNMAQQTKASEMWMKKIYMQVFKEPL